MIRMIVGRCHVGESNLQVIRYVKSRMKKGAWRKLSKAERKQTLREIIEAHSENQDLYHSLMTGRF